MRRVIAIGLVVLTLLAYGCSGGDDATAKQPKDSGSKGAPSAQNLGQPKM